LDGLNRVKVCISFDLANGVRSRAGCPMFENSLPGPRCSRAGRGNLIICLMLVFAPVSKAQSAQELTFASPGLDAESLRLSLRGEGSTKYVIETSTNLTHWRPIFTGFSSVDGQLEYSALRASHSAAAYYMARSQSDIEKLTVVPQVDSNYVALALITTNGGACSLTSANGVVYTFTVPPLALTESTVITMTLLTNIAGFPLTNGFGAAVSFGPEGLEFYAPALLQIQYPTNIPTADVVSYAFSGNGTELYVVPDLVSSNAITIPVLHFSGVGSSFGAAQAAALFAGKAIEDQKNSALQNLAAQRHAVQNGEPAVYDVAQDFYDRNIKPGEAAATTNCELFKEHTRCVLALAKELQYFGMDTSFANKYLNAESCAAFANCLKEAEDLCPSNPILAMQHFRQIKQMQALGTTCPQPDEAAFLRHCRFGWNGYVTYSESGQSRTTNTFGEDGRTEVAKTLEFNWFAQVLSQQGLVPATLVLALEGPADAFSETDSVTATRLPCGKFDTLEEYAAAAGKGKLKLTMNATFRDAKLVFLTLTPDRDLPLPTGVITNVRTTPSCSVAGATHQTRDSVPYTTDTLGPASLSLLGFPPFPSPPFGTIDEIVGTYVSNTTNNGVPVEATWTFNLKRVQ
jgi:hypothetical protein